MLEFRHAQLQVRQFLEDARIIGISFAYPFIETGNSSGPCGDLSAMHDQRGINTDQMLLHFGEPVLDLLPEPNDFSGD